MAASSAFPQVDHPVRGPVSVTACPFHLDGHPTHPSGPAPHRVGQHTRAVLTGMLGYSAERVATLEQEGVIEAAVT